MARKAKFTWSTARKISQGVFLLFWLVLFTAAAALAWPADLVHLPAQLDPLLMIVQAIAARALVGGALFSLIVMLLSLVFGRAWCGWICPMGTVLDWFPFKSRKKKPLSEGLRGGKYLLLAAILIAALFGNLTLLIFDPITLWIRTLTGSVWPGLNTAFTAVEYVLVRIPFLSDPITWLDQVFRPAVFPASPVGIRQTWLPLAIFIAIILLNLLAERFWCRYLCPLGGLLGLLARFAPFKRTVGRECKSCGHCTSACPTGTIDPARGYASDPAECTLCMDCLPACPTGKIGFTREAIHPQSMPYDPDRRAVLAAGLVTAAGLAVVQTDSDLRSAPPNLLRPPGTRNEDLLRKCLRCGLCMRACPTGALQPSLTESGLAGLFTPVSIPRLGYCLYSCNACGQICPVEAIPPLALEDKQKWVIGRAFIDQNRCIPWADGTTCIVCEEMCPLPEKAITLEERTITSTDGQTKTIKLPHVLREKCVGCGICEYKCPRAGEAAIRVYRADIESG